MNSHCPLTMISFTFRENCPMCPFTFGWAFLWRQKWRCFFVFVFHFLTDSSFIEYSMCLVRRPCYHQPLPTLPFREGQMPVSKTNRNSFRLSLVKLATKSPHPQSHQYSYSIPFTSLSSDNECSDRSGSKHIVELIKPRPGIKNVKDWE